MHPDKKVHIIDTNWDWVNTREIHILIYVDNKICEIEKL